MKRKFVVPELRLEATLPELTLTTGQISCQSVC